MNWAAIAVGVTLALGGASTGRAAAPIAAGEALYFAAGWRTAGPAAQNVLQLGTVYPCGQSWCVHVEEFSGKDNLPRQRLAHSHAMQAPSRIDTCSDERLTTVRGAKRADPSARIESSDDGLVVQAGPYRYTWTPASGPAGGLLLAHVRMHDSAAVLDQAVGFAYRSDDVTGRPIRAEQLMGRFDGEIAHKNTLAAVADDWMRKPSSIEFRNFYAAASGPVLGFSQPGHPDVIRRLGKAVWVHHSLLLPADEPDRLRYVLHEYGHDFNANGCFDEFGHNKQLLPVMRDGSVAALVYIEYTPDKFDGVPMVSVGRYFRKH